MNGTSRVERLGAEKTGKLLWDVSSQTTLSLVGAGLLMMTGMFWFTYSA
jgi:hypothetical protein